MKMGERGSVLGRVSSKWKFEGEEGRGGATLTCVMVAGRAT